MEWIWISACYCYLRIKVTDFSKFLFITSGVLVTVNVSVFIGGIGGKPRHALVYLMTLLRLQLFERLLHLCQYLMICINWVWYLDIVSSASIIWFISKVIWAVTIGSKSTSRLAITASTSRPVALIAAHISNMVAFASNPRSTASCC